MAPPASSAESAAPSKKMESAGSNMTPPPAPPTPGKKSYMSGLDSDTDTGSTPPAEPAAPAKKGAKAKSAAKSPAPAATPAPAAAEGVTPEAPGSAELKNTYESKLKESAPTVSTAPAGPTAAGAPPSAAAVAEPPAMAEAPPASQGSLAFGKSAGPSVQVFDSGMPGGSDMSMAAPGQIGTVYFGSGSAELDEQDIAKLREVAAAYKQRGGNIRVVGYASSYTRDMDPVHHQMVNFTVSMRRADAVARELARLGVKPASIFVTALSDSQPVYYESMPAGRAGNQRAEIFIDY
jgi:outer membrane protein OmpA-like peptidoglycan-associated protein